MVRLKTSKKSSISSIGEKLRKARETKGVSFEEVHRATKIHPRVLEALEENRLENILGITYVKAFLRSYAQYLRLDVKKIIQEYSSTIAPKVQEKPALEPKPFLLKKDRRFSHAIIVTLVVIAWFFILNFATVKFIRSYKSFVKNRKLTASVKPKEPKKLNELKKPDTRTKFIPIPKRRTISLTIATDKDVWLKVIQDGEVAFHGILSKNSKETWQADKEIRLTEIGRPEALSLHVNGKDIDFSGKRLGKNIFITHEGINLEPRQKN